MQRSRFLIEPASLLVRYVGESAWIFLGDALRNVSPFFHTWHGGMEGLIVIP